MWSLRVAVLGKVGGEHMSELSSSDSAEATTPAPQKRGRHAKRSRSGTRRQRLTVYLTDEQREVLELRAKMSGQSLARTLVDSAIQPVHIKALDEEKIPVEMHGDVLASLRTVRRNLEGMATNLNQVAHHANTVSEVPSDFAEVVSQVRRSVADINELLRTVRR